MASTSTDNSSDSEKRYTGYIYNLINNLTGEVFYTGSTTQSLKRRLSNHKSYSFNETQNDFYSTKSRYIREIGRDNFRIEMLTTFEDVIQYEKSKLEKYYMEQNGKNSNTQVPGRSMKEYYYDNIEEIKEKKNKVCKCLDCGFTYTYANRDKHMKSRLHADGKMLCYLD